MLDDVVVVAFSFSLSAHLTHSTSLYLNKIIASPVEMNKILRSQTKLFLCGLWKKDKQFEFIDSLHEK